MGAVAIESVSEQVCHLWEEELAALLVAAPGLSTSAWDAVLTVLRALIDDAGTDDGTRLQIGVTIARLRRMRLVAVGP
jgi:hypothetical protein